MSRITAVVVALATTAAVLTGSTSGAAPLPAGADPTTDLPRRIAGGVELTMADGDRLRLWATANHRAVVSRRWDAATRAWGPRLDVVRNNRLRCGQVDARTANGAVAAIALCDRGGYHEDSAPVASRALWSPDGVTWSSRGLDGEAHEEPGISPDGQNAVWPQHQRYTTRTPAGWSEHALRAKGQEYTVTATITDTQQVSFLYGGQVDRTSCPLVVLTRTGDAEPVRQEVDLDNACSSEAGLENVDVDTALFGYLPDPGQVAVVSRPDASSPWAVTRVAPQDAPGLLLADDRPLHRQFFTAPGAPLVALGSRSSRRVRAQVYDPGSQTWGQATTIHQARARCTWSEDDPVDALGVLVAVVTCGDDNVVLTTRDGLAWQALRMGPRPLGQSRDGRYVAVPGPTSMHVISPERGVVTLPGGVRGRCDVVVPDGPEAAVHVVAASGSRRWPVLVERVTTGGTVRLGRVSAPTPGRCRDADQSYDDTSGFDMISTRIDRGQVLRVVRRGGSWKASVETW